MGSQEEERFLSVLTIQRTSCSWTCAALDKLEIFFVLGLRNFLLIYTVVSMLNKQRLLGIMRKKWVQVCSGTKNWDDIMCPRESLRNLCWSVVWPNYSQQPETQVKICDKTNHFYLPSSLWSFAMCPKEQQTNKWWERSGVLRFAWDTSWETCYLRFSEVQTVFSISDGLNNATFPKLFNSRERATAVLLNENRCSMLNIA